MTIPVRLQTAVHTFRECFRGIQRHLSFETWGDYPEFASQEGLGRVALISCLLGIIWGAHFVLWIQFTLQLVSWRDDESDWMILSIRPDHPRTLLGWQWCIYVVCLCSFHLLEFFVTALKNPGVVTANSFLVNHSTGYTAAAITAWTEFGLRVAFWPRWNLGPAGIVASLLVVIVSQTIRSWAMATAGESFNHMIQIRRKENHVLVTWGIYKWLRHPSYVGFYYWSVSMQCLLGNMIHAVLLAIVAWVFFQRRIAYEEESLCAHFEEYPAYVSRTYMGIPFLWTQVVIPATKRIPSSSGNATVSSKEE